MAWPPVARSTPPTKNAALVVPLSGINPAAEAVICLFRPASLHSTLVNVAVPLPIAVPRSRLVVPRSEPEPAVKASETLQLAGNPTVERLPNWSCDTTTGWAASGEPVRDVPPGWVVNANWLAVLGLTTMLSEIALVNPDA